MVKSSRSKSVRKQLKKMASCTTKCDQTLWSRMNRNAVAWSVVLLVAAVVIVDIPAFRETFVSNCGNLDANSVSSQCQSCVCSNDDKDNSDLSQFNRGMPLSRQSEAIKNMEESMNAGKIYRLLFRII